MNPTLNPDVLTKSGEPEPKNVKQSRFNIDTLLNVVRLVSIAAILLVVGYLAVFQFNASKPVKFEEQTYMNTTFKKNTFMGAFESRAKLLTAPKTYIIRRDIVGVATGVETRLGDNVFVSKNNGKTYQQQ